MCVCGGWDLIRLCHIVSGLPLAEVACPCSQARKEGWGKLQREGGEGKTFCAVCLWLGELQSFTFLTTRFPRFPPTQVSHAWVSMVTVMEASVGIIFTSRSLSEDKLKEKREREMRHRLDLPLPLTSHTNTLIFSCWAIGKD